MEIADVVYDDKQLRLLEMVATIDRLMDDYWDTSISQSDLNVRCYETLRELREKLKAEAAI